MKLFESRLETGNNREIMQKWIQEGIKVQTCITSPPYYRLRDYKHEKQDGLEKTPEEYVENLVITLGYVKKLLKDDGTLWLVLGDSYSGGSSVEKENEKLTKSGIFSAKDKDLIGIPWMVAFALRADGWYLRQDIIWQKPNPMPESVKDRCTKAHEYIFLLTKSKKYYFDAEAIKTPVKQDWGTRNRENNKYRSGDNGLRPHSGLEVSYQKANKRSVWSIPTFNYKGAHFATFPPKLVEPCVLAGSRPEDIVLDPYIGSGTTAVVAKRLGRKYLGCDINPDYEIFQEERLKDAG
jgi:DNA modification methylase